MIHCLYINSYTKCDISDIYIHSKRDNIINDNNNQYKANGNLMSIKCDHYISNNNWYTSKICERECYDCSEKYIWPLTKSTDVYCTKCIDLFSTKKAQKTQW